MADLSPYFTHICGFCQTGYVRIVEICWRCRAEGGVKEREESGEN